MSVEGGGDRPQISQHRKELVDSGFSGGRKLYGDSYNMWTRANWCEAPEDVEMLTPLPHYKQNMEEAQASDGKSRYPQEEIEYVVQLSDPASVAAFDQLIDEFNADLERIKREKDFAAAKRFAERAHELIYKKW